MKRRSFMATVAGAGAAFVTSRSHARTVLRVGTGQAAADLQVTILNEVAERVAKRTNGELTLQLFPGGQLGSERDVHEQVKLGAPILTIVDSGYFANYTSRDVGILSAPFVFTSYDQVRRVLASDLARGWLQRAEGNGIRMLSFNWFFGERHIVGKKPFPEVADLRAVKFRLAPIPIYIDSFKQLGVSPVTIDFAEVYGALQQGVVDAAEGPLASIFSSKLYEPAPNVSLTGHVKQVLGIMMNKGVFDGLPAAHRTALVEEFTAGGERYSEQGLAKVGDIRSQMERSGVRFVNANVAAYSATVVPMYQSYKDWTPGLIDQVRKIAGAAG